MSFSDIQLITIIKCNLTCGDEGYWLSLRRSNARYHAVRESISLLLLLSQHAAYITRVTLRVTVARTRDQLGGSYGSLARARDVNWQPPRWAESVEMSRAERSGETRRDETWRAWRASEHATRRCVCNVEHLLRLLRRHRPWKSADIHGKTLHPIR